MYKGQVKDEVLKRFRKMGYNIDCRILKACDYGVPQMRKGLWSMQVNAIRRQHLLVKKILTEIYEIYFQK